MRIDGNTKIYGILGYPLSHSFSPNMYNAAFDYLNANSIYIPLSVKNLTGLKMCIKKIGIQGLSVTIPHKVKIRRLMDKIDPIALRIGSVNTVKKNKENLLEGYNTDGLGALQAIRDTNFTFDNKHILIIGSGGSARAIACSLLNEKISSIGILGRNKYSINQIARSLSTERKKISVNKILFSDDKLSKNPYNTKLKPISFLKTPEQIEHYDLIINTTPIGMKNFDYEGKSPLAKDFIFKHQTIFDIVYNPQDTPFIKLAEKNGSHIIYGYKMLLHQGVLQFNILTDMEAPIKIMEKALLQQL